MSTTTKSVIIGLVVVVLTIIIWAAQSSASYTEPTDVAAPVLGNPNASIVVQEFSDFQCPACGAAYPIVEQLLEKYGNALRFEYKHYPLVTLHPNAFNAAMASECANDQGKFEDMYKTLFEHQTTLSRSNLTTYAGDIGLDTGLFDACMDSRAKADDVNADRDEGDALGVTGTPTFFVDGEQVPTTQLIDTVASLVGTDTNSATE